MLGWVFLALGALLPLSSGVHRGAVTKRCGGFFLSDLGRIISHNRYGRKAHPNRMECVWRISSHPGYRIHIIPTSMSLEASPKCAFDSLKVYNGWGVNETNLIGSICGSSTDHHFVTNGSRATVRFRSDRSVRKAGFVLRYMFEAADDEDEKAGLFSRKKPCKADQMLCQKSGLCIPDAMKCDGINDCGDSSDEHGCPANTPKVCRGNRFSCDGKQCIPRAKVCDGKVDCANKEDEMNCALNVTSPELPRGSVKCGRPKIKHRIVGGKVAKPGSWPWTVSLRQDGYHVCGGSIVNKRWIVTAAHCVEGATSPDRWAIHAGRHHVNKVTGAVQKRRVSRVIVYPKWDNDRIDYDYTLMKLSKPLKWTKYVLPICLPTRSIKSGSTCYISGWGDTKGTGGEGRLKQGRVKTFSRRQCSRWYGGGITKQMVCAGRREGGVDSCQGDSGGPLACETNGKWVLHGATSFGGECGAPNSPGVYAKIYRVRSWIRKRTGVDDDGGPSGPSC